VIWAQQMQDAKNQVFVANNMIGISNVIYWLKQLQAAKQEEADVLGNWRKD
jgi:hypothetical protein